MGLAGVRLTDASVLAEMDGFGGHEETCHLWRCRGEVAIGEELRPRELLGPPGQWTRHRLFGC